MKSQALKQGQLFPSHYRKKSSSEPKTPTAASSKTGIRQEKVVSRDLVEGHTAEVRVDNGMGKCCNFYWGESETSVALMISLVK